MAEENLEVDLAGVVEFTQHLVQIPSVYRPDEGLNETPAAELVARQMKAFHWSPQIEEAAPGRPNVICELDGGKPGPSLLFEGHTDVVTEGDSSAWSHDPFGGEIENGRLYGRGAADMKGGVAAMMFAADAVVRAGPFPGRIVIGALADEEGMMLGAKSFVSMGHAQEIDAAIICEPEGGEVCVSQKGAIRISLTATGRMAHGAMPDHGKNPIPAMAQLILKLHHLQDQLQQTSGFHEHLGLPFVTPTVVRSGDLSQLNVIPGSAILGLDLRTIPGVNHRELLNAVREIGKKVEEETGVTVEMTIIDDRPPSEISIDSPVVKALVHAHESVMGKAPAYGGVPGTTDGTILWRDAGIPCVVYGPGGKWIAHQVDEFVEVSEIQKSAEVYALAAIRFFAVHAQET